ncbi:MAG TPA: hypothetical protein VNF73_02395 [Candidatus Saccharimonadales bacterium]|nr:hypothetical protein [Candidatus Saccharimonadales bacterium]
MKYLRTAFDFLYDFLVGDAWELFVGPIAGVAVAWLVLQAGLGAAATGVLMFLTVVLVAGINLTIALRGAA